MKSPRLTEFLSAPASPPDIPSEAEVPADGNGGPAALVSQVSPSCSQKSTWSQRQGVIDCAGHICLARREHSKYLHACDLSWSTDFGREYCRNCKTSRRLKREPTWQTTRMKMLLAICRALRLQGVGVCFDGIETLARGMPRSAHMAWGRSAF